MKIMKKLRFLVSIILIISFSISINAASHDIKIIGEEHVTLPISSFEKNQTIKLNKVILSPQFKNIIKTKLSNLSKKDSVDSLLPKYSATLQFNVDLGMENVPVLDQGYYGTCTTFATTAALDAIKQAGDYISQQCLLELGNYESALSEDWITSGWEGAIFEDVFNRINQHGIVDKKTCPHKYAHPTYKMNPNKYKDYSYNSQWAKDLHWNELFSENGESDTPSIEQVKQALDNGHRVLIGSLLLFDNIIGSPINNNPNGLWEIPEDYSIKQFIRDLNKNRIGGHAIIVTGYDETNKLFKIRNSWGKDVGEQGDFYMTYDYFDTMTLDAYEVF